MEKIPSLSRIKNLIKIIRVIDFFVTVVAIAAIFWLWWFEPEPKTEFWTNFFQNNIWKFIALLLIVFVISPAYGLLTYLWKYKIKTGIDMYHGNNRRWKRIWFIWFGIYIPCRDQIKRPWRLNH